MSQNNVAEQQQQQQLQVQTQIQIQQLMFNLNAAYHEISTQRTEMSVLRETMRQMNTRLDDLASTNGKLVSELSLHNGSSHLHLNRRSNHEKSVNSIGTLTEEHKQTVIDTATQSLVRYVFRIRLLFSKRANFDHFHFIKMFI